MKKMLLDIWSRDSHGFLTILFLNIAVSLTGGISIVMLVPMLGLLEISEGAASALSLLTAPLHTFPYEIQVVILIASYFVLVVCRALLSRLLTLQENRFLEDYSYHLRKELYGRVSEAKWEQLAANRQTDTINLFTSQCNEVSYGVSEIIHLLSAVVTAVVQLCIAIWLSLPVTLFVIVCGGLFTLVFRRLTKASKSYGDEMIRINRAMYSELFSQLRSIKEVRTYGVQQEHEALFDDINQSYRDARLKYVRLRAFPSMLYSVAAAGMIGIIFLVCVLGFKMDTARLIVLVYVFTRLWPVFSGFINRLNSILTTVPAYEKLSEALRTLKAENRGSKDCAPLPFERDIEFRNVSFSYQNSEEPVLRGVSFRIAKGTVTALVGRSGAGKTTIADLLLGLLTPTAGEILIDGVPLTPDNLPAWRYALGYVPQEPLILNASVRENLQRFHPGVTEEEMIDALKKAQAWPIIENLPQGLDTLLGDEGVRLSGGERQRIVLARVLQGKPRLIVMDEATSAMDYESETAVREAIRGLSNEVTILVIAHRLATVRSANDGLVLENGRITENGPLSELMNTPNGYLNKLLYVE